MKKNFIVTCHGWSASNWTAHALNINDAVLCTHSARNVPASDKELQSNKNLKIHINQLQKGYALRQGRGLDVIYDEIEAFGDSEVYGSVHVLRMRDLPVINENYGSPNRSFKIANVVRNPIDLVWSGYGQFKDLFRYDINELHWTSGKVVRQALEYVNDLGQRYNLNIGDFDVLGFLGACAVLESLRFDLNAYNKVDAINNVEFVGSFQMEQLTTNPDYFSDFFNQLGLEVHNSKDYIDQVFDTGIINKHKHDSKKLTPEERYAEFTDWQKEAFNHFMELHDLKKPYESFGYDLSFLK